MSLSAKEFPLSFRWRKTADSGPDVLLYWTLFVLLLTVGQTEIVLSE